MLAVLPRHFSFASVNDAAAVLVSDHHNIVKVILNRPRAYNAVNNDVIAALHLEISKWNRDPNVKVISFISKFKSYNP